MHDLDRTTYEAQDDFRDDELIYDEEMYEDELDDGESYLEDSEEDEMYEDEMYEDEDYDMEGYEDEMYEEEMSYDDELALATQMLGAQTEEEMDELFGRLIRKGLSFAKRKAKKWGRKGIRRLHKFAKRKGLYRKFRRFGKRLAKRALSYGGRAAGTFFGGPLGGAAGASAGKRVGKYLGLEMEGMSPEDQEMEVAKRLVRFTIDAAQELAMGPLEGSDEEILSRAFKRSASKHLPGLNRRRQALASRNGGRWIKRGNRIVLLGV